MAWDRGRAGQRTDHSTVISGSVIFRTVTPPSAAAVWYANDAGGRPTSRVVRSRATMACDVAAAGRIEAPLGDLHQYGFNGEVVDLDRARAAVPGSRV